MQNTKNVCQNNRARAVCKTLLLPIIKLYPSIVHVASPAAVLSSVLFTAESKQKKLCGRNTLVKIGGGLDHRARIRFCRESLGFRHLRAKMPVLNCCVNASNCVFTLSMLASSAARRTTLCRMKARLWLHVAQCMGHLRYYRIIMKRMNVNLS